MIKEFEKKLEELGLSYQACPDNSYLLHHNIDSGRTIKVKLIYSTQPDESEYGSRNGNNIQSIGVFKFSLSSTENEADFYILVFGCITNKGIKFVIIPSEELKRSLARKSRNSTTSHKVSIVFWLMADQHLYDCTNLGIEGEWYFMSLGVSGRMADKTIWDYTEFLNDWNRLILI